MPFTETRVSMLVREKKKPGHSFKDRKRTQTSQILKQDTNIPNFKTRAESSGIESIEANSHILSGQNLVLPESREAWLRIPMTPDIYRTLTMCQALFLNALSSKQQSEVGIISTLVYK